MASVDPASQASDAPGEVMWAAVYPSAAPYGLLVPWETIWGLLGAPAALQLAQAACLQMETHEVDDVVADHVLTPDGVAYRPHVIHGTQTEHLT